MNTAVLRSSCVAIAALALGGCSMFRDEPASADATMTGDDGRLISVVEAIREGAPLATDPAAFAAARDPYTGAAPPAEHMMLEGRSVLYALHLASYRSETSAEAGWRIIAAEAPQALSGLHPRLETVDLGPDRGVYLRLKAGPLDSRDEAAARCAELVNAGHYCQTADFEGRDVAG